jgi:predicted transcriptional regulator
MDVPRPTDAELDILRVLWERGPSTVRDVYDTLSKTRSLGYTTVLKLLQIMFEKQLVSRDESQRSHVYRVRQRQEAMQRHLVKDFVDRAFGGSMEQLVLHALSSKRTSKRELAEIRKMLDQMERGEK